MQGDKTMSLEGRAALVTGGSRGIGLATAQRLAASGATVWIVGRSRDSLEAAAALDPERLRPIAGDVADAEVARICLRDIVERHGRLDILVNNAGGPPPPGSLLDLDEAGFAAVLRFNLEAPLTWIREAYRSSMGEHGGVVLNISSIGGLTQPRAMGAYAVAKAGLLQMTRVLAAELGPRVRVNAIAPGLVKTDATAAVMKGAMAMAAGLPLERLGEPEDIAAAAHFLVSDAASWITGETLTVDGGTLVQTGKLKRAVRREGE